ncbi:MAG: hypothetical protein HZA04_05190 [Nitrospinae bacterium]|nr:hypothetical protein [Nitrospinota bacterium]
MAAVIESLNKHVVMSNIPFTIEEERVLKELRIAKTPTLKDLPEQNIARYIKKAIDEGYALMEPKAVYRTFRLVKEPGLPPGVEGAPGLFFGKKIAELLTPCDYVTLLLTTIGPALPGRVETLGKTDATDSFYLDAVGGWMADYLADRVEERIVRECEKNGYTVTMRYSPGYGDWTLDAQPMMMKLLESKRIGVALTDTLIMIPRKSVSAAIGWLPRSA